MRHNVWKLSAEYFLEVLSEDQQHEIKNEFVRYLSFPRLEEQATDILRSRAPYSHSWLYSEGEREPYVVFELIDRLEGDDLRRRAYFEMFASTEALMPLDVRAIAAERWKTLSRDAVGEQDLVAEWVQDGAVTRSRTLEEKADMLTDGIDHLFDIPVSLEHRLDLLKSASAILAKRNRGLIAARVLGHDVTAPSGAFLSSEVETLIEADVASKLVRGADYIVGWDDIVLDGLTIAELARIALLSAELRLPSIEIRQTLLGFYRSAFRVSGRAIIGLGAGVFHVEHGTLAVPSYFYMGRDTALGKGCMIDGIGGAVFLSGSFAGGGFMPLLIHTHKHLRNPGEAAIRERYRIRPCIFLAEAGARFPMHGAGLFETADFIETPAPYPGIRAMRIHAAPADKRICL